MALSKEKSLDDKQRLLAMREYLGVRSQPDHPIFEAEVIDASVRKVQSTIEINASAQGEEIIAAIARQLSVRFEEVRSNEDIAHLENKYLVERKELGFGMLAHELCDPSVDALLFQRMHAAPDAPDRWVAVLNLQETQARAYWSRPHELIHRLAEPPQQRLQFYRHRSDTQNHLERIIDAGAAELAFPRIAFEPRVTAISCEELSWDLIKQIQYEFAPTSSLLSAAKAVLRYWPRPAFLISAEKRGRRGKPNVDVALRMNVVGLSPSTRQSNVQFFPNMRVPMSSPLFHTYTTTRNIEDVETLSNWTTSTGDRLPDRRALTSGYYLGRIAYAIIALI